MSLKKNPTNPKTRLSEEDPSAYENEMTTTSESQFTLTPSTTLALLCLAVAPPILISIMYAMGKNHQLITVPWESGDSLMYAGAISAALIAAAGVHYTIRKNLEIQEKQARETRVSQELLLREKAAPFFAIIFLEQKNKRYPFQDSSVANANEDEINGNQNTCYSEVEERRIYAFLNNQISYQKCLSQDQMNKVTSAFICEELASGIIAESVNPVIYVPLWLKNIGGGAATGVRVGVNRIDEEWAGVCYWTLERGERFYLGVYADTSVNAVFGSYQIRINFFDCLGYQYMQSFRIDVVKPEENASSLNTFRSSINIEYVGSRVCLSSAERERYLGSMPKGISGPAEDMPAA